MSGLRDRSSRRHALPIACAAVGTLFIGSACTEPSTGLDEATYVDVMSRLTLGRIRYMDTPQEDSARAAVLEEFGVSGRDLMDFAERYGHDVERMDRLWEEIRFRIEELESSPVPENEAEGEGLRLPSDGERRGDS